MLAYEESSTLLLIEEENSLYRRIKQVCDEIRAGVRAKIFDERWRVTLCDGGNLAYRLHTKLSDRGLQIKYSRPLLENRQPLDPEKPAFFDHPHAIDELIRFIECPEVNDNLGVKNLHKPFHVLIRDQLKRPIDALFKRTEEGWFTKCSYKIEEYDDRRCSKFLENLTEIEGIVYPYRIGDFFEYLWEDAEEGLELEDLHQRLNDLAFWISSVEQGRPYWC